MSNGYLVEYTIDLKEEKVYFHHPTLPIINVLEEDDPFAIELIEKAREFCKNENENESS